MAATQNHDYHLVDPDPWPIIGAAGAFALFGGTVMWLHANPYGKFVAIAGVLVVLVTMASWWSNTIREADIYHTPVVQLHLRYGMILFIASEVMFFLAWFWAFFDSALFPCLASWPSYCETFLVWRNLNKNGNWRCSAPNIICSLPCAMSPRINVGHSFRSRASSQPNRVGWAYSLAH